MTSPVRRRAVVGLVGLVALATGPAARVALAQDPATTPAPAAPPLSLSEFFGRVARAHPEARQAALGVEAARADLLAARGGWEPTLKANWERKRFSGTEYWDDLRADLVFPTPLGADFKIGYERASGRFLNLERSNLQDGLFTAGFSVPVTRGIVTDERRLKLQQVRAKRDAAVAEQDARLAKLLATAAKDYATWLEASRRVDIAREGVRLAELRLRVVQAGAQAGDLPAIDTIDARNELNRRRAMLVEAQAAQFGAARFVEAQLWSPRGRPEALTLAAPPPSALPRLGVSDPAQLQAIAEAAARAHPDVIKADATLRVASAERLFAMQSLLPKVDVGASGLSRSASFGGLDSPDGFAADYKLDAGVEFRPLFLKQRGEFESADAWQEAADFAVLLARRLAEARARVALNDLQALEAQIALQEQVVEDTRALLAAERFRFEAGETTLLILTLRERQLLDELAKLAAVESKLASSWGELASALGEPRVVARYAVGGG